jgi:hypothetical protein
LPATGGAGTPTCPPDEGRVPADDPSVAQVPRPAAWPTDDAGAYLAYSEADLKSIISALDAASLPYEIADEDQPDPDLLAALQGTVATRSEALAALATGSTPVTIESLKQRLEAVESGLASLA